MTKKKLILHIGQHKTGSKALQFFLAHHRQALARRGILYSVTGDPGQGVRAYTVSHYRLFALLRLEAMAASGATQACELFWAEHRVLCQPFDSAHAMLSAFKAQSGAANADTILISAEDLFDMHTAHESGFSPAWVDAGAQILARIAKALDLEPVIVVYLRRQDHLLGAHYGQYIKTGGSNDLDFASFAEAFAPRLRTNDILDCWARAFGPESLRLRTHEPSLLPHDIVTDFFEHVLGFAVPTDWSTPPLDAESANRSLDRNHLEFLRALKRRETLGLPTFLRDDLLEAALQADTGTHGTQTHEEHIASWLSPQARRALLALHANGNAEIANRFHGLTGGILFKEPPPADDENWCQYPGLSAEAAMDIAYRAHQSQITRQARTRSQSRRRLARIALGVITGLAVIALSLSSR